MTAITAVAVLVPARDEEALLPRLLRTTTVAASGSGVPTIVVVAADSCADATAQVGLEHTPHVVTGEFGSPARARAAAATCAMTALVAHDPTKVWLATTDADCIVAPDWLEVHRTLADLGYDVIAGDIVIDDWSQNPDARISYEALLASRRTRPGTHTGVYGANLGIRASTLARIGGVPLVPVGEDRAIWDRVDQVGRRISTTRAPVTTSARRHGRAVGGLADLLADLSLAASA